MIRDDATGGDCTSIGLWASDTKTCTLGNDFAGSITIVDDNITLDGNHKTISAVRMIGELNVGTTGVTVKNLIITDFLYGISINGGTGNTIICNTITGNGVGINLDASDGNFIAYNEISTNDTGILVNGSAGNTITSNKFASNTSVQAEVDATSTGNIFSQNYFDDFDTPGEGCLDADSNGICDAAYVFTGGSDLTPRTSVPLDCGQPDLQLFKESVYWGTYANYQARLVYVDYYIQNMSSGTSAYGAQIISSSGNNGVTAVTAMPIALGDIGNGATAHFTVQYQIPTGVGSFISTTTGSSTNVCGTSYTYPQP